MRRAVQRYTATVMEVQNQTVQLWQQWGRMKVSNTTLQCADF